MSVPSLSVETIKQLSIELQHAATHGELATIFSSCGIEAPPGPKHHRIFEALKERQEQDRCGNNIIAFLQALLKPSRFLRDHEGFENYRGATNKLLAFEGLHLTEAGQVVLVSKANTILEAEERAGKLRSELSRRRVHPDVLKFCKAELMDENYFHAILEATKSVAQKIRDRTGLTEDGSDLVDRAFARSKPLLVWNALQTLNETAEHGGTMNLLKGIFSLFRNPTAHDPKINRTYSEDEALELMTLVSLLHRRIDQAHRTPLTP